MRQYRPEIAFAVSSVVSGLLLYLALLGQSGVWRQTELQERVSRLRQSVEMMRQENRVLFARLHGPGGSQGADELRVGGDVWVFKFSGTPDGITSRDFVRPEARITLAEARILFLVGFVLFLLVGLYFTATVTRRLRSPGDALMENGVE